MEEFIAKPETWNNVAKTYKAELEDGDCELADSIEKILLKNGLQPDDSLIEMGCGSGHLSLCLAKKGYKVTLVDFSPAALDKARQIFDKYGAEGNFILGDLFQLDDTADTYDFAWNSGVMEHFGDAEIAILMKNIGRFARKGVLYLVPNSNSIAYLLMRARLMADDGWPYGKEYLRRDYDVILKRIGYQNVSREYVPAAAISAYQIWKAEKEQGTLSILYRALAEENMLPQEEGYLIAYYASNLNCDSGAKENYISPTVQNTKLFDLTAVKIGYAEQKKQISELTEQLEKLQIENESIILEKNILKSEAEKAQNDTKDMRSKMQKSIQERNHILDEFEKLENSKNDIEQELTDISEKIYQKDSYIMQIQSLCCYYATAKLSRLSHFMIRLKVQWMRGSKKERKAFWAWIKGRVTKTNHSVGEGWRYNPWMDVHKKLQEALTCGMHSFSDIREIEQKELTDETKEILSMPYTKYDVIVLSVIDYDFRHQRPQHFASLFAENGHRVFYINANFDAQDSVIEKAKNLHVVNLDSQKIKSIYETDWSNDMPRLMKSLDLLLKRFAVCDAVTIVDYPNWIFAAEYLKEKYGFKIIADYMDDYTGFLETTEEFLKDNCIKLLKESSLVVSSSQFLYDIAKKYTDEKKIVIVRNGTQTEHFYKAFHQKSYGSRKVIGYYGAVSHWFAYDKVCYLADNLIDCDIYIIGEVTAYRQQLEAYENIKLLGEIPYVSLPEHLAYFDVCLIPFDTSTDLIKATNPVKFYEYLSAGKKIVATEIPELMPYRNQYVYMSNENQQFMEYVKLCLEQKDTLKSAEECLKFARMNAWNERFKSFSLSCRHQVPKVSIIVLTYNNELLNRQCIESILSKTAYADYELIIVDNASIDGTCDYLAELANRNLPHVKVILNNENLGFAGGNNCGIKAADGDYVILLNNDTIVTRGWVTNLVKHLENDQRYAMCNPVTNSIGNESQIKAEYKSMKEMIEFSYKYTMEHMGEEYKHVDRMPLFATIIRRSIFDKAGMLDENYKIGMFEDDDFTERVLQAGYQFLIAEDVFIHHIHSRSFKNLDDEEYRRIFEYNKEIYEKKWQKKWQMPKYRKGIDAGTNRNTYI